MKIRYKLSLLIIGLMLLGCLYITQSYALWVVEKEQTNQNEVEVGCFSIGFSEQSESINLNNTYPMSDSLGLSSVPYTFTITNTCTINNSYVLTLNTINTNTLDVSKIKYALYKSSEEKPTVGSKLSRINNNLENLKVENLGTSYILDTGILTGGTKVDGEVSGGEEVTYNLYLWIDEIAGNEVEGQTFEAGINVVSAAMEDDKMPAEEYIKRISTVENGDGLYKVSHNDLEEIGQEWNKTEYRYAGVNPNNYVRFNNEIWRIIGLVNVKTENGVEQRVKIIRQDGIEGQKEIGKYYWDTSTNDWTKATLKNMLNGIYYESTSGDCYKSQSEGSVTKSTCDFNSGTELPKGLNNISRTMVDKEIIWNLGGWNNGAISSNQFYEKERNILTSQDKSTMEYYSSEWSKETDIGEKYNGIGLMYPSDYGYAVGGEIRANCLIKNLSNYTDDCVTSDWLKSNDSFWTLTPYLSDYRNVFRIISDGNINYYGNVFGANIVWPTLYLKSSVKILENQQLDLEYGTVDNPFQLIDDINT